MIIIEPVRKEHENMILEWRNSLFVSNWFCHNEIISPSTHRIWFNQILSQNSKEGWMVSVAKKPCGIIMLQDINLKNKRLNSGYFIGIENYLNRGLGVIMAIATIEIAFNIKNINKICGEILACNQNAVKVADLIGWEREGFLKNHLFRNDGYHDIIVNAYHRFSWENPKNQTGKLIDRIKPMYKILN